MKFSVVIPAFNCEDTLQMTLESVFCQTAPPYEILALNDGSTDGTASLLGKHAPRLTVLSQPNRGVGPTLNALCARARGDVVAVLGSDDIWHPKYLETQQTLLREYPGAVAYFTGHVNFSGTGGYEWSDDPLATPARIRLIPPAAFLSEYNAAPGPFACMSHCCVPARALRQLGDHPFQLRLAEDLYFFNRLGLLGPVLYASMPLVGYRIRSGSLSSDRLRLTESEVRAFELIVERHERIADRSLRLSFHRSFAAKRRLYAKTLMGANRPSEARRQLAQSTLTCADPASVARSLVLLLFTVMPARFQPDWPPPGCDPRLLAAGDSVCAGGVHEP